MREAILAQPPKTAWPVAAELLTNAALLFATFQELVDHVSGLNIMEATVRGGFTEAKNDKTDGSRMKRQLCFSLPHLDRGTPQKLTQNCVETESPFD